MKKLAFWGTAAVYLASSACSTDDGGGETSDDGSSSASGGTVSDGDGGGGTSNQDSSGAGGSASSTPPPTLEGDCTIFPTDNAWNTPIDTLPVHENSDAFVASVGADTTMHPDFGTVWDGAPIGIPYVMVDSSQDAVPVNYVAYGDESDPGPFPIPLDAPIEGGPDSGGDRHVIAIDTEACKLYELFHAFPQEAGWDAHSGVEYDLTTNEDHPEGCTSADAAGLPVFPGLVRYDEVVEKGEINHALRFTVQNSQRAYVYPARHYASDDSNPDLPPMGLRFRMKADFDCDSYSSEVQVICTALKTYGMLMADNGSNWYLSGAPDSRWDDDALRDLKSIPGSAFEVVDTGDPIITESPGCPL